jgi:hypothetical protein
MFAFSNNCYKELLNLICDILPKNHKMLKDMYQSKKMISTLGMEYEKIDMCKDNCIFFYKEHKNKMKCLKQGSGLLLIETMELPREQCQMTSG